MKMRRQLIAGALAFSAFTTGAHADQAGETLVKSFIEKIDKLDAWSAAATRVSSEGTATVVEGLTIARTDGPAKLEAAKISLDRLAEKPDGGLTIDVLNANGLKLSGATWALDIPSASGRAIATPSSSGFNFDSAKPFTSLAQIYTALTVTEFDDFAIARASLAQTFEIAGTAEKTSTTTRYSNFRLDHLKKGMLAGESIERIDSATAGTAAGPVTIVFEGFTGKNFDLAGLAHVVDPAAYAGGKGDGLWKTAFESAGYAKISVKNGTRETFSAGPITMTGWQVRQTPEPVAPLFDQLFAAGPPGEENLASFMREHIGALLGWFRIGSISAKAVNAFPQEGGRIALASLALDDLSIETLKRLAFEGLAIESPEATVRVQGFEMGDVIWPSLSAVIAIAQLQEANEKGIIPDVALIDQATSGFLGIVPRIGTLAITGVEIGIAGGQPFKLGEYRATTEGGTGLLPRSARAKLSGVIIPGGILHASPEMGQIFDALGYSEILIEGEGETDHDEASGRYTSSGRLAVKDAGILSMASAIGGLTAERVKALVKPIASASGKDVDQSMLMVAAGPISIESFTLRFDDASLIKRLLPFAAKMQGMDEATLIGNTTAIMQIGLAALGNQTFTSEAVGAVGAFLKEPKSLSVALRPTKPVTIQELMALDPSKPGAAIDLLGVHVTAND
jgi:hypothetical protein